jgi:hypothetical protein
MITPSTMTLELERMHPASRDHVQEAQWQKGFGQPSADPVPSMRTCMTLDRCSGRGGAGSIGRLTELDGRVERGPTCSSPQRAKCGSAGDQDE